MHFQKKSIWIFFTLIVVLLSGCAVISPRPSEEVLRERVEGYLQAKIARNRAVEYSFYEPSFRKAVSKEQFIYKPQKIRYEKYKIESIEILPSGKEAEVSVKYEIKFQGFTFKEAPEIQHWIKTGNKWYLEVAPRKKASPMEG